MRFKLLACGLALLTGMNHAFAAAPLSAQPSVEGQGAFDPQPAAPQVLFVESKPTNPVPIASTRAALLPANLVYVQVSRDYLRKFVDHEFTSDDVVNDNILDTPLDGHAHTSGLADLVLEQDDQKVTAHVVCAGTIESRTLGHRGPFTLHNETHTEFTARKQLVLDETGLHAHPAIAAAKTTSATKDIDNRLSGPKGRLLTRMAWNRVHKSQGEVETIASRHAEASVAKVLDRRVEKSLADFERMLSVKASQLVAGKSPARMQFRSTLTHVHLVVYREDASTEERALVVPAMPEDCEVAVRIHRTVALRVMADPAMLGPLVGQLLRPQGSATMTTTPAGAGVQPRPFQLTWSPNREWLTVTGVKAPQAVPIVAN
jgi:hypothetical protein